MQPAVDVSAFVLMELSPFVSKLWCLCPPGPWSASLDLCFFVPSFIFQHCCVVLRFVALCLAGWLAPSLGVGVHAALTLVFHLSRVISLLVPCQRILVLIRLSPQ